MIFDQHDVRPAAAVKSPPVRQLVSTDRAKPRKKCGFAAVTAQIANRFGQGDLRDISCGIRIVREPANGKSVKACKIVVKKAVECRLITRKQLIYKLFIFEMNGHRIAFPMLPEV